MIIGCVASTPSCSGESPAWLDIRLVRCLAFNFLRWCGQPHHLFGMAPPHSGPHSSARA